MSWRGMKSPIPNTRAFQKEVADGFLNLIVGLDPGGGWHMSISHADKTLVSPSGHMVPGGRVPTYEEIKEARYKFCPNEIYMAMILPPREEFVNVHPTTMHLYQIR